MSRFRAFLHRLLANRAAISAVEFALVAPVLTAMGLGAIEMANMAIVYTRVSQVAIQVADNASRAKQVSGGGGAMMREYDVNEAFHQASIVYPGLRLYENGRVILSSLEQNASGGQWIHWQRCRGTAATGASKYGTEGTGSTGTGFAGMGPSGNVIAADPQSAIMFVEVYYRYQPIFFPVGGATAPTIYRASAMYVRDDRDLTQIYNPVPTAPVSGC